MIKIFIGLGMIAIGVIEHFQLGNRRSWWMWTNWRSRGFRQEFGDSGYENFSKVRILLLIGAGIFFILDQALGFGILPESRQ
ncbi:MAG: hypothetical protein HKO02_05715 [Hyphomonadaceae bacterium]|nr:hypothetical protein [Hyphomonadaceae bacterium]